MAGSLLPLYVKFTNFFFKFSGFNTTKNQGPTLHNISLYYRRYIIFPHNVFQHQSGLELFIFLQTFLSSSSVILWQRHWSKHYNNGGKKSFSWSSKKGFQEKALFNKPTGPWGLPLPPCLIVQPKLILALRSASQPISVGDSQTSLSKKKTISTTAIKICLFTHSNKIPTFFQKNILLGVSNYNSTGRGERLQQGQEEFNFFCLGFKFSVELCRSGWYNIPQKIQVFPKLNYTALTTTTPWQRSCTKEEIKSKLFYREDTGWIRASTIFVQRAQIYNIRI